MIHEEVLVLTEQQVAELLTQKEAIEAAENVFSGIGRGEITVGTMSLMFSDDTRKNNFHSMPAVLHSRNTAGVKWISTYKNPAPGYPFNHGNIVILSDTLTGSPYAIVGATGITTMRTAGGHGVVQAKYLSNPDPEIVTVMGCGAQGKSGIRGLLTQFPSIRQVRLFSRSREPMEQQKQLYRERTEVVICNSPEEAAQGSRLIMMASGASVTLLKAEFVLPGTTVIGIEGFRDIEPSIARKADKWYLGYKKPDQDILNSINLNPGKTLTNDDVFGDMTELLTGKIPGREREDEIIVSTHMGMGAHDVWCACDIYEKAVQQGIGTRLSLA